MEQKDSRRFSPIVVIVGPTASGKSSMALKLAEKIPSEIVSADSMQCYRMMDIGTAKPSPEEMRKIPHHLIDIFDINERISVYDYAELMEKAVEKITSAKRTAIIVGGTGLYVKAFLYGLDTLPSDEALRNSLCAEYEHNPEKLENDLEIMDPAAAKSFSGKLRKMIRAIEVYKLTGKSILEQNLSWKNASLRRQALVYKLKWERQDLFKRIAQRIDNMLKNGWIEEAELLANKDFFETPTARQAIGYFLISKYLKSEISFDEMRMRIISATKKYARRQETWFNNQHPESSEILMPQDEDIVVQKIVLQIQRELLR